MTTQRERFEAWAKSEGVGLPIEKDTLGYIDIRTIFSSASWQEAERQMIERFKGPLETARDYVAQVLAERRAALAGYPHRWRQEESDLAMIDEAIRALGEEE